jgi:hypothetical protein
MPTYTNVAGRSACALLLAIATVAAADSTVPERTAVFTLDSNMFVAAPPAGVAPGSGFGSLKRAVKRVVHTLTDRIRDTVGSVTAIQNDVGQVLSDTVKLSSKIPQTVRTSLSNAFDHRPEWFVDPPPWLDLTVRACTGISFDCVNSVITLEQAATDGHWSDADKALLINTIIHEGVAAASIATQDAVMAGTAPVPMVGVVINVGVAYGFDRLDDELTDRISQHYRTETSPGSVQASELKATNAPIMLTLQDGVVIPSVTVANAIVLGGADNGNFTVVTSNEPSNQPSYYVAGMGGKIIIKSNTVIIGEVRLQVATSAYLPADASQYARDLIHAAEATTEWVDNVATPSGTAN